MGPHPAVAAVRSAVREALALRPGTESLLVACSGGPDSVALAAAAAFECDRAGRPAGFVTVDHGLQAGSHVRARAVAALGWELGFDPVHALTVTVGSDGGPEAAARAARYEAIEKVCPDGGLVLLGHTADDQAETVILGLGRGSGARSLAGMRPFVGHYLRPFLGLRRSDTLAACDALGLPVWHDPHNDDRRFRRVRVRREVLPLLEDVLAGGVVESLVRTAEQLQDDEDAFALLALRLAQEATLEPGVLDARRLVREPPALVRRVLKRWAEAAGAGPLTAHHVGELARLVFHWSGQGPIDLPGGHRASRASGTLSVQTGSPETGAPPRPDEPTPEPQE